MNILQQIDEVHAVIPVSSEPVTFAAGIPLHYP